MNQIILVNVENLSLYLPCCSHYLSVSQSEDQTGQPRPIRRQATLMSVHNLSLTRLSLRAGNQVRRLVMAGLCARLRLLQILSTPLYTLHITRATIRSKPSLSQHTGGLQYSLGKAR